MIDKDLTLKEITNILKDSTSVKLEEDGVYVFLFNLKNLPSSNIVKYMHKHLEALHIKIMILGVADNKNIQVVKLERT